MTSRRQRFVGSAVLLVLLVALVSACGEEKPAGVTVLPPPTYAGRQRTITLADDTMTITLHVGERFLLQLGEEYEWTVEIDDPTVVSRVTGVTTIKGSQGLFEARRRGSAMVLAAGEPPCYHEQPPCEQPSHGFRLDVVVQ